MIRKGNVTTFKHVKRDPKIEDIATGGQHLIVVYFDGCPELWGAADVGAGFKELEEYYRADWAGTRRVLPVLVFDRPEHKAIVCI